MKCGSQSPHGASTGDQQLDSETLARRIADLAGDRKGLNILVIDVRGRSSYTDFLVIASGTSDRHVQSIGEAVADAIKRELGLSTLGVEGLKEGQWALVDFGEVVLHVFHQFTREIYALEDLWKDAPRLAVEQQAAAT